MTEGLRRAIEIVDQMQKSRAKLTDQLSDSPAMVEMSKIRIEEDEEIIRVLISELKKAKAIAGGKVA